MLRPPCCTCHVAPIKVACNAAIAKLYLPRAPVVVALFAMSGKMRPKSKMELTAREKMDMKVKMEMMERMGMGVNVRDGDEGEAGDEDEDEGEKRDGDERWG